MKRKTILAKNSRAYSNVAIQLRAGRKLAGLKQEYVGEKLGKYSSWISKIENGDRRADFVEVMELADLYNLPITFFAKGTEERARC
jgi:transcriptional regulator with XRE-family HTH domain